ncbi:fatty acyl-AMP ligase [Actinomadura napierensis]|uniref:Fatty acyl-AMP ligase n=1 Tax=Actinomadura napierensis TaxID=267854 RepID=A0ABN2ZAU3_9ACTN
MDGKMHTDFVSHFRENVRTHGDRRHFTFVTEEAGPGRSYKEDVLGFAGLDRRAGALARRLQERGLRDRAVLLLYPEGLEFIAAFVGCLYARVVAVPAPLPVLDAGRFDRTRRIIADADISWILTDGAHLESIEGWLKEAGLAGKVQCLDTEAAEDEDPGPWTMPEFGPDTLAFLQYTSGSTSEPKGVMVTHGNLVYNAEEIRRRIQGSPEAIGVGWVPHFHDMGLVGQFLEPLYLGMRYVLTSPITFIKRPVLWLELVTRHRATIIVAPNFGYELTLRRVTDRQLETLDLSSLQTVKNGAEPVRAATLERWNERFAPAGFEPRMWMPCYGMAEATLLISAAPWGSGPVIRDFDAAALTRDRAVPVEQDEGTAGDEDADEGSVRRLVSSGRPVTLDVRIVDPESLEPLPDGRAGEIWVRGGSVAAGYWHSPVETRATFQAYTAGGEGPFLRTGDLGFVDGGELFVTGRSKDLIIVNGRNIHAHDIEETAQAAHPAALVGAAFVLDGTATADGREQVVLVQEISTRAAAGTPPDELAGRIKAAVARAHELPALSVVLTGRGTVRRTTSGKLRRGPTRQALLDGEVAVLGADLEPGAAKFVHTHHSQKHD